MFLRRMLINVCLQMRRHVRTDKGIILNFKLSTNINLYTYIYSPTFNNF